MTPLAGAGLALAIAILILTLPSPAYAYLDPQTGSMIVSAVVAFLAALGMGVQSYWHKAAAFFRPKDPPPEDPGRPEESPNA